MKKINFKVIVFIALSFSIMAVNAQTKSVSIIQGSEILKCSYSMNKGRIDGNFVSYYENGKKRAEGKFENNYRIGKWSVWDTAGKLRMVRVYENPFVYKIITPQGMADTSSYKLERDENGLLKYFRLREKAIFWSQRIWRNIEKENNDALFDKDRLFKVIYENLLNGDVKGYGTSDDEFKTQLSITDIQKIDTGKISIKKYKMKEDAFFDTDRNIFECGIIGICPVAINKETGKEEDLFWIYYPQLRKPLAKETLNKPAPSKIKTLDDVFFLRDFASTIYKESNVWNKAIADSWQYKEDQVKEAERIELSLIENEHDIWIGLTK